MSDIELGTKGHALFSPCRKYRYMLSRKFSGLFESDGWVNFIMLNPSTATQDEDDPTIKRCIRFAQDWGFAGLYITNIFALRSTDPKLLYRFSATGNDAVGPENDENIKHWISQSKMVICGWGAHGELNDRGTAVMKLIQHHPSVKALCLTKGGFPGHPLYISGKVKPFEFKSEYFGEPWKEPVNAQSRKNPHDPRYQKAAGESA